MLRQARKQFDYRRWHDGTKQAKGTSLAAQHAMGAEERKHAYQELLNVAWRCVSYIDPAVQHLKQVRGAKQTKALTLAEKLEQAELLVRLVIDQTEQRVLHGKSVPASDKIVSLFEAHTDIIVKERGKTHYGHKVYLTAGASGLITDCVIAEGNPADSEMTIPMLRRQARIMGKVPEQAAFDGGFSSKDNLARGKALGVKDLVLSKHRGITISEMASSTPVYRLLRNFRAGIEGLISYFKRVFGLRRCTWRGAESFGTYVLSSVVAGNLLMLARHLLT